MNSKYIHVWLDATAWLGQGQCILDLVDRNALKADGYLLSTKGEHFFNNFFRERIFSQTDYHHMIENGLRTNKAGMQLLVDTIKQQFDRFDRTHEVTAEQVLLQFCGMIDGEILETEEIPEFKSHTEKELEEAQKSILAQQKIIVDLQSMVASLKDENEYLSITLADKRAEVSSIRNKLRKQKKHRSLGDRVLQLIGFVYWIVDRIAE